MISISSARPSPRGFAESVVAASPAKERRALMGDLALAPLWMHPTRRALAAG